VRVAYRKPGAYNVRFEGEVLAVRTASGVHLTEVRLSARETAWYWTITYATDRIVWKDSGELDVVCESTA
jgi:hypothetical protein